MSFFGRTWTSTLRPYERGGGGAASNDRCGALVTSGDVPWTCPSNDVQGAVREPTALKPSSNGLSAGDLEGAVGGGGLYIYAKTGPCARLNTVSGPLF